MPCELNPAATNRPGASGNYAELEVRVGREALRRRQVVREADRLQLGQPLRGRSPGPERSGPSPGRTPRTRRSSISPTALRLALRLEGADEVAARGSAGRRGSRRGRAGTGSARRRPRPPPSSPRRARPGTAAREAPASRASSRVHRPHASTTVSHSIVPAVRDRRPSTASVAPLEPGHLDAESRTARRASFGALRQASARVAGVHGRRRSGRAWRRRGRPIVRARPARPSPRRRELVGLDPEVAGHREPGAAAPASGPRCARRSARRRAGGRSRCRSPPGSDSYRGGVEAAELGERVGAADLRDQAGGVPRGAGGQPRPLEHDDVA